MEIAWAEFTPVASFAGGAMIGVAALFLMLLNGRVMGMSGILSGLLAKRPDWAWRLAFVFGVIVGPLLFMGLTGAPVERQAVMSGPLLYVAAFLVGLGTARVLCQTSFKPLGAEIEARLRPSKGGVLFLLIVAFL